MTVETAGADQALDMHALKVITAKKLVNPKAKRAAALCLVERFGLNQPWPCRLMVLERNTSDTDVVEPTTQCSGRRFERLPFLKG